MAFLPILIAGILMVLYSQFYLQNWMESSHICRTELLKTQEKVQKDLEFLLNLNIAVKGYRSAMILAQAQLAAGIASVNPGLIARATAEILRIERLQKQLGSLQTVTIAKANASLAAGVANVARKLRLQSSQLQSHLPNFFKFRIHSVRSEMTTLAVKPDRPDVAPVYELKKQFKDEQALHVSWISEFQTTQNSRFKWITNRHQKKDSCSATLDADNSRFKSILHEARSFWK